MKASPVGKQKVLILAGALPLLAVAVFFALTSSLLAQEHSNLKVHSGPEPRLTGDDPPYHWSALLHQRDVSKPFGAGSRQSFEVLVLVVAVDADVPGTTVGVSGGWTTGPEDLHYEVGVSKFRPLHESDHDPSEGLLSFEMSGRGDAKTLTLDGRKFSMADGIIFVVTGDREIRQLAWTPQAVILENLDGKVRDLLTGKGILE
jgi:hypothetical protein